ncbi:hypothetical protein [Caballeronia ptereochthonis]|uniref:hypothetical protein n=1 Tax=Caballeronia ptereochthonis TaxID=1777144 RepID=UPI001358BB7B|nr:hypothetical protein [Caballeronia ptereochthonis]
MTSILSGRSRRAVALTWLLAWVCEGAFAQGSPVPRTSQCPLTSFTAPPLFHPNDPRVFGAKCDGVTDDSAAFQKAINAGDVKVAAGTCLINKTVTVRVSQRRLECAPGTLLKRTVSDAESMFLYDAGNGALIGNSIVNCNFEGANSPEPVIDFQAPGHWDIPVLTRGNVSNFLFAGNTMKQFFGQSFFQTTGDNGGSGDRVIFNTFMNCPLYGPAFVGHMNGYIGYNRVMGCMAGIENDHATDNTGGNILECNKITASNGASGNITGGVQGKNTNYSGNIVRYNLITGKNTGILQKHEEGGRDAQYIGNSCIDGCRVKGNP